MVDTGRSRDLFERGVLIHYDRYYKFDRCRGCFLVWLCGVIVAFCGSVCHVSTKNVINIELKLAQRL